MNAQTIKEIQRREIISALVKVFDFSGEEALSVFNRNFFSGLEKRAAETWLYRIVDILDQERGREFIEACQFCVDHKASRVDWLIGFFCREGFSENEARLTLVRCTKLSSIHKNLFKKAHKMLCLIVPDADNRRELVKTHPEVYLIEPAHLKHKRYLRWTGDPDTFWNDLRTDADLDPEADAPGLCANDWQETLRIAVLTYEPDWNEKKWRQFASLHPWIFERSGTSSKVLDELIIWLNLPEVQNWPDESARFIVQLCVDKKLHPILQLNRKALCHRLFVLRRYLEIDFRYDPEALLEAWETLSPDELRFRVNEIQARGLSPQEIPWPDLLAAERETFINQIEFHRKYSYTAARR